MTRAQQLKRAVGLEPGMRFALRAGGRTVGAGLVTRVREGAGRAARWCDWRPAPIAASARGDGVGGRWAGQHGCGRLFARAGPRCAASSPRECAGRPRPSCSVGNSGTASWRCRARRATRRGWWRSRARGEGGVPRAPTAARWRRAPPSSPCCPSSATGSGLSAFPSRHRQAARRLGASDFTFGGAVVFT